jgi:ATP-dependent helicase/nuclease subunit A
MSSSALQDATDAQRVASNPAVSAFVAASAGSGKTKLLTDRLLRLMLGGADPGRIQCLTFTKAAAAEMALRLQGSLGAWVTLDDPALDGELAKLDVAATAETRGRARALFARVLDQPGGMRIGTIHAFCQSLLKRFPLEARLPPHFSLIDETDAAVAMTESREAMLGGLADDDGRALLTTLAGLVGADGFGALVGTLMADRARLGRLVEAGPARIAAAQARLLRARPEADILAEAVQWQEEPELRRAVQRIAAKDTPAKRAKAGEILAWLGLPPAARMAQWDRWAGTFLTKGTDGLKPRDITYGFLTKKLEALEPDLRAPLTDEMDRILMVEDARAASRVAAISAALVALALPVAAGYGARKEGAGKLDYDDLIGRTNALLANPGAAWVLYKLDGGLDHLLLDEVQDTAPAQWQIAAGLTAEFFAGEGAAGADRTVFAVGDRKQSIYGFQGADPDGFALWRGRLRDQVQQSGRAWRDVPLQVSFRSTDAVLGLVDAVFAAPDTAAGVVEPGDPPLAHRPTRAGQAGRVELWPLAPLADEPVPDLWPAARRNLGQLSAERRLAEALAEYLAMAIGRTMLESKARPLAAGDVLVLVRRRREFSRALVRALKSRNVPVAGIDRMTLTDQPAVADLLALCDALLLPQDDLALACVLTSPLGGISDDSLTALAAGREGTLWDRLRARAAEQPDWQAAHAMLAALLARTDYISPHALLAEALGPLGGRARLLARLGPEAAEPVDELLAKALDHAASHPPSLQGFLHWLRQSSAEVKREAEGAAGAVRIMTVHGAKGLQAPLVIIPDTTALPPDRSAIVWRDGIPLWSPRREFRSAVVDGLRQDVREAELREQNRLLYVALTRAEDRLIICGWQPRKLPENCWYEQVRRGFPDGTAEAFAPWEGELLVHETPQTAPPERKRDAVAPAAPAPLPGWAGAAPLWQPAAPPAEPDLPVHLAPSRPENAALGEVPGAASPLAARDATGQRFRRGQLLHALLQHLPALPPAAREAAALRWLDRPGQGATAPAALAAEALAVLNHPALAPLFGPEGRAEVPLTGVIAGRVVGGLVDRIAVLPDRILLADYKTNRDPPASAEATPVLYLRQLAAYAAVLAAAFPGRPVEAALVWTMGASVMPLPAALLARYAPGAEAAA